MWRHFAISLLGLLVAVTPWALGYANNTAYVGLALVLGGLILAGGLFGLSGRAGWLSRSTRRRAVAIFGLVTATTPWLSNLPHHAARVMVTVVAGLIVLVLAVSEPEDASQTPSVPKTRARAS